VGSGSSIGAGKRSRRMCQKGTGNQPVKQKNVKGWSKKIELRRKGKRKKRVRNPLIISAKEVLISR